MYHSHIIFLVIGIVHEDLKIPVCDFFLIFSNELNKDILDLWNRLYIYICVYCVALCLLFTILKTNQKPTKLNQLL